MTKSFALLATLLVAGTLSGCGNDNPLYPTTTSTGGGGTTAGTTTTGGTQTTTTTGGTTANLCGTGASTIGYNAYAAAVLNQYCVTGCHVAGGLYASLPLDTYANASAGLTSSSVFVVGNGMPPSNYPQLSTNQNCILQTWVQDGDPQ